MPTARAVRTETVIQWDGTNAADIGALVAQTTDPGATTSVANGVLTIHFNWGGPYTWTMNNGDWIVPSAAMQPSSPVLTDVQFHNQYWVVP